MFFYCYNMRCKVADLIVGASNFVFSFCHPIGLGIVLSNEQLEITKIVIFKFQYLAIGVGTQEFFLQLVMIA